MLITLCLRFAGAVCRQANGRGRCPFWMRCAQLVPAHGQTFEAIPRPLRRADGQESGRRRLPCTPSSQKMGFRRTLLASTRSFALQGASRTSNPKSLFLMQLRCILSTPTCKVACVPFQVRQCTYFMTFPLVFCWRMKSPEQVRSSPSMAPRTTPLQLRCG